jgi:hypothetical protein
MKIYDLKKFNKYRGHPVRIKSMGRHMVAIAEGALLATFKDMDNLRLIFPSGKYKIIEDE